MTGFEPRISGIGSDRSTNCVTYFTCFRDQTDEHSVIVIYDSTVTKLPRA